MLVSFFTNKLLPATNHTNIIDQFNSIKEGKYKMFINKCRTAIEAGDSFLYKSLKEQLPAVTFCGTFKHQRKANQISNYNKLLILDVDNLDDSKIQFQKDLIENDPHTFCCFLSPSGKGLKFLVKVSTSVEHHKQAFMAFSKYYLENYQITIDKSGSDCSRLCYMSYDPGIYINIEAKIFEFEPNAITTSQKKITINRSTNQGKLSSHTNIANTFGYNDSKDRKIMSKIITYLKKNKYSITETQEKWYKCAYAIANTFTFDLGQKYFIELSRIDGEKYDEDKSYQMIKYCYTNRKEDGLQFNTILFFAKEKGFKIKQT
jgi:hypothetical protein